MDRTDIPMDWIRIMQRLVCGDHVALATAKRIGPFVTCVTDKKRLLFGRNYYWHNCVEAFLILVQHLVQSQEGLSIMLSYNGMLPFLGQTSCLVQRDYIVVEAKMFQLDTYLSSLCGIAQDMLYYTLLVLAEESGHITIEGEVGTLDVIAHTPLSSDDPYCNVSVIVGMIRMIRIMQIGRNVSSERLAIVLKKFLTAGYADEHVIAELVKLGNEDPCSDNDLLVARWMKVILGLADDFNRIQPSDSKYAAAIRHGFFELIICIESSWIESIQYETRAFLKGLFAMACTTEHRGLYSSETKPRSLQD